MKLGRFFSLAAGAVLVVGAMAFSSKPSHAQAPQPQTQGQAQATEAPEKLEAVSGPDKDTVNEQLGGQIQDGTPDGGEAPGAEDAGSDEQSPSYSSTIAVDQAKTAGMSEADEAVALAALAKISAKDAEAAALAANPGNVVVKTELDNENGALVFSVQLSNGADVKVDAGNGSVLFHEKADKEGHEGREGREEED